MGNDKINNNNYEKKNTSTDIRKSPIELKKRISNKFPTTLINQKESHFSENLSKEIERIKKKF